MRKYTLKIQQIGPKYSLYLIMTSFSNVNYFWSRPPISLFKVTFWIYRSMPIILWGCKFTNMLLKYNRYGQNTVCILFGITVLGAYSTNIWHLCARDKQRHIEAALSEPILTLGCFLLLKSEIMVLIGWVKAQSFSKQNKSFSKQNKS